MHIHMPDMTGSALLKSAQGKLLEVGEAVISLENRSADFHSEFVHLFKMGTPLKIVLTKGDVETQSFEGEVYLSTQNMLRLVDVSDRVLPGAKTAYMCETDMAGTITAIVPKEVAEGFMNLQRRQVATQQSFDVNIHAISMSNVHFTCERELLKGQYAELSLPLIGADDIFIEVDRAFDFGQTKWSYHCRIRELGRKARISLDKYVAELCEQQFKLF